MRGSFSLVVAGTLSPHPHPHEPFRFLSETREGGRTAASRRGEGIWFLWRAGLSNPTATYRFHAKTQQESEPLHTRQKHRLGKCWGVSTLQSTLAAEGGGRSVVFAIRSGLEILHAHGTIRTRQERVVCTEPFSLQLGCLMLPTRTAQTPR